jgi:hypothetical protein
LPLKQWLPPSSSIDQPESQMSDQNKEFVVSYLTLRKMIGWVGLLMPITVRLGALIFEHIRTTDSISAYYYTGMRDVFVSTLILVGVLLACYRTPARRDNVLATVAGLAAIGIGLFPMDPTFAAEILQKYPGMDEQKCYINRGFLGVSLHLRHRLFCAVVLSGLLQV